MNRLSFSAFALIATFIGLSGSSAAQAAKNSEGGNVSAIVTVLPKSGELPAPVPASDVHAKINGKKAEITDWHPFQSQGTAPNLQLLLLIDDSARSSLGLHLKELQQFLISQPPTTEEAVAYMQNSGAPLSQGFTTNHEAAAKSLRIPLSVPGGNGSPYFVLSDVVKHWNNPGPGVRREVVMVTDGIDRYNGLRFDPQDPYVQTTIKDCLTAGVAVYSIYFRDAGFADQTGAGTNSGQNYLLQLSQATGGHTFYQGFGNPVSFAPFLAEISKRLNNQYELALAPPPERKGLANLKVQVSTPNTRVEAPQQVVLDEGK
jgi:hypothetical protein